jgi:hypothetical protein
MLQRLAASESCVVQQQREILALRSRMQGVAPASAHGAGSDDDGMLEAAALREENLALEKELQVRQYVYLCTSKAVQKHQC